MGRSTSCFKIMACGGDSADKDDHLQVPGNQSPTDKRRWSFRKRSARHRVLNNTVITEVPSTIKESPESANLNLQTPDTSIAEEKILPMQCSDEKLHLSTLIESKASETIVDTKDEGQVDFYMEESLVIVIQAAVRGILARRELFKLKNVVKLQAAARGHLVRQHALGTLRCIHAIVKMQTLVRAHRAPLLLEDSYTGEKFGAKQEKTVPNSSKERLASKPHLTYEKLLRNSFARQLMASTPKTRPIHIKCDPMRPNYVWNWLERWMAVSSTEPTPCSEATIERLEREKNEKFSSLVETKETSEFSCETANLKSDVRETILPSEDVENLMTSSTDRSRASHPDSSSVEPQTETIVASDINEKSVDINFSSNKHIESDMKSQTVLNNLPCKPEIEREQPDQLKRSMKRNASEQLETEGKKVNSGSEKISNPEFIAAQSKFEELSLTANSNGLLTLSHQVGGLESNMDTVSSGGDSIIRQEPNVMENLGPHNLRGQYGGSECGTELSITSTLDSPDRSEIGGIENEVDAKVSDEESIEPNSKKDADIEGKGASTVPTSSMFKDQPEKGNEAEGESENSFLAADCTQTQSKLEISASDVKRMLDSETGGPVYRSSPEASPRSHVTVPESQGTPSSQLSGAAKKNRTEKSTSNHKRKSVSADKRSPSNPNHESGARSTAKQFPKDQKIGKRRNSFGSTRPQPPADQEPRDSSSSNSLPHFMQATESARAKIHANNSPRSSPDMQDRDYIKKRHSLPGANGRQGSPRVQRSMTQPQQAAKGNGGSVVHEHKWQR